MKLKLRGKLILSIGILIFVAVLLISSLSYMALQRAYDKNIDAENEKLDQIIAEQQLEVAPKTYDCLTTIFREMDNTTLYTNKSFKNGSAARKVLEYNLADRAAEDRASVAAALKEGKSLEEASAPYVTEEAFEEWYNSFCDALKSAVSE